MRLTRCGGNSFAQFLYDTLVAGESSGVLFGKLKALHAAFPYWLVRQAFKIGRAKTMAKYLQDILLARPFGSKSLLQKCVSILRLGSKRQIADLYLLHLRQDTGHHSRRRPQEALA